MSTIILPIDYPTKPIYESTFKAPSASGFQKIVKVFDYVNSELIREQHIERLGVRKFFKNLWLTLMTIISHSFFGKFNYKIPKIQKIQLPFGTFGTQTLQFWCHRDHLLFDLCQHTEMKDIFRKVSDYVCLF